MRRLIVAVIAVCAVRVALAGETLTIATYNVENYGPANRVIDGTFHPDYPKPESEKDALRKVIRAIGADVIVLQEMGTGPYLEELQQDLRADGAEYPYSALAVAADVDRHVALLSRRPLISSTTLDLSFSYLGGVSRVKRGLLAATLRTAAGELTIFAVHLKSRLTERADDPDSAIRRTAEATAIRDAILKRFPDPATARFIVLGDCNDSKASKALTRLQHRGQTAIAVLLPAIDAKGETWTYAYKREDSYARIDHILVSPALRSTVIDGTAHICDVDGVTTASDHRPVYVRLQLGEH